jgi:hypothetical protein
MAAVVPPNPQPRHRGHPAPRGRVRAGQADAPRSEQIHRAAISTPWRDRAKAAAQRRERRVADLRNAIGA